MGQLRLTSIAAKENLLFFQRTPYLCYEEPSSKYMVPYKKILPPNIEDDKSQCFRCHAPN